MKGLNICWHYAVIRSRKPPCYLLLSRPACSLGVFWIRKEKSCGTWGKTFVFTDDLDINNRLYHQLCDAEGWRSRGQNLYVAKPPLASQRLETPKNSHKLTLAGQNWRIALDIGHSLDENDRAIVARTSSQDVGVDPRAEVVIATASLEVGFNDPSVGMVIQHKAPRNVASYLQRKGRAGRSRTMRPWMVAVLSEFGRDRVVYQRYEELINPEIKDSCCQWATSISRKCRRQWRHLTG